MKRLGISSKRSPLSLVCLSIAIRTLCITVALIFAAGAAFAQNATPAAPGWVVLPVDQYAALKRAAFPIAPEPAPPPVEAPLHASIMT